MRLEENSYPEKDNNISVRSSRFFDVYDKRKEVACDTKSSKKMSALEGKECVIGADIPAHTRRDVKMEQKILKTNQVT